MKTCPPESRIRVSRYTRRWLGLWGAPAFLLLALASGGASAQDGGVYVYRRAALELESGAVVTVNAGVALDGPVALARAQELERARAARPSEAPSWVATLSAVVASVVFVADSVRRWVQPTP